jgi:hypothetical protein
MQPNGTDGWQQPALTIDEFEPDRPCVRIFGVLYPMLHPMDLSLRDEARFSKLQRDFNRVRAEEALRAEQLGEEYEEDPGQADFLSQSLGEITQIILIGLPDEVLARISDRRRLAILEAFGQARSGTGPSPAVPLRTGQVVAPLPPLASPSKSKRTGRGTGERSSQSSVPSTPEPAGRSG